MGKSECNRIKLELDKTKRKLEEIRKEYEYEKEERKLLGEEYLRLYEDYSKLYEEVHGKPLNLEGFKGDVGILYTPDQPGLDKPPQKRKSLESTMEE